MRNDECPECLKTNKPTHLAAIAGIITLTYLNYYIYTLTFAISITVYLITFKLINFFENNLWGFADTFVCSSVNQLLASI